MVTDGITCSGNSKEGSVLFADNRNKKKRQDDDDNKHKYKKHNKETYTIRGGRKYELNDNVLVPTIVVFRSIVEKGTDKKLIVIDVKRSG